VFDLLRSRGASFVHEIAGATALPAPDLRRALGELVTAGLVASDAFAGLREIIATAAPSPAPSAHQARGAGRWWMLQADRPPAGGEAAVEACAWALLRRYGVVFRRLLAREANAPPWRALTRVYRRLEARGEIRGGRFVTGVSGEQFALPDAVDRLRETRRTAPDGRLVVISAADPLNLTGILTTGERVRTIATNRLVYRDGLAIAAMEGDYIRQLGEIEDAIAGDVASLLAGRRVPAVLSGYVGRTG
jgi:ATP-dependent Lhr-like helicase